MEEGRKENKEATYKKRRRRRDRRKDRSAYIHTPSLAISFLLPSFLRLHIVFLLSHTHTRRYHLHRSCTHMCALIQTRPHSCAHVCICMCVYVCMQVSMSINVWTLLPQLRLAPIWCGGTMHKVGKNRVLCGKLPLLLCHMRYNAMLCCVCIRCISDARHR